MSKKIIVAKAKPDNLNRLGREGKRGGEACKGREGESRWAPWEWGVCVPKNAEPNEKSGIRDDRSVPGRKNRDR